MCLHTPAYLTPTQALAAVLRPRRKHNVSLNDDASASLSCASQDSRAIGQSAKPLGSVRHNQTDAPIQTPCPCLVAVQMTLCHDARRPPPRPIPASLGFFLGPQCLGTINPRPRPIPWGAMAGPGPGSRSPGHRRRHHSTHGPLILRGSWGKHRGSSLGSCHGRYPPHPLHPQHHCIHPPRAHEPAHPPMPKPCVDRRALFQEFTAWQMEADPLDTPGSLPI